MAATNAGNVYDLVSWAKMRDPDLKAAMIAELLNQSNEQVQDLIWLEGNNVTSTRITQRIRPPCRPPTPGSWNSPVAVSRGQTAQVDEAAAIALQNLGRVRRVAAQPLRRQGELPVPAVAGLHGVHHPEVQQLVHLRRPEHRPDPVPRPRAAVQHRQHRHGQQRPERHRRRRHLERQHLALPADPEPEGPLRLPSPRARSRASPTG